MKKRTLWLVPIGLIAAGLVLVACGAAEEPAAEEPAAEEPAVEEPEAEEPEAEEPAVEKALAAVDLVMWSQDEPDIEAEVVAKFDAWAAENAPGSTLEIVHFETEDLRTEFQTAALAGTGPIDI